MKIPKIARQFARKMFRASFSDGQLDEARIASLVQSLVEHKPRGYVAILQAYQRYLRLEIARRRALVETATPMDDALRSSLQHRFEERFGSGVEIHFSHTPDLIGGMRIRLGSDVWDGSVKGRLERLEREFSAG